MKNKRLLIAITGVLAIMLISSSIGRYRTAKEQALAMKEMPEKLEQQILSFDLSNYGADGIKKWNLKGDSADILAEVVNLNNINMETFDAKKMTVTSVRGAYNKSNKEISLYEDVVVVTADGAELTTDYLKWNGLTDSIVSDKPVRIVRSDVIADGTGATAFPQMKRVILNKDVTVRLATDMVRDMDMNMSLDEVEPEGESQEPARVIITCDGQLEIDYEKNIAIFEDNVLVDDSKGKIFSDRMEAFLDPVTKDIVKVVAEGDVKVERGEDSTFSQKAIYTTADRKITLVGRPRIYIHSTEEMDKIESELEGL